MLSPLQDLNRRDTGIVERVALAHMMMLMLEKCQHTGLEIRPDIIQKLNVAAAAPLSGLDVLTVSSLAQRADDLATALLYTLAPEDPAEGLYCCATFCLLLVAEGRFLDAKNMAVLVALMLMDDVRDDQPDANGLQPVRQLNEARWQKKARSMFSRAVLMGYYIGQ